MVCKTYDLKVDKSRLSREALEMLKRLFLEARWFYNDLLARGDVFHADYMTKTVQVFDKEGKVESPPLRYLSAQIRQEILDRTKDSILGLARLRRSG